MSFPCPPLNPCPCNRCLCSPVDPCPPDTECCLRACSGIIACDDAIGPCGQSGTFDLTTLAHITTGCTDTPRYALESHDGFFPFVEITEAGILTWITPGKEFVDQFGMITFRMACATNCDECIVLEDLGCITIGVKNLCQGSTCAQGEECDLCDGTCVTISVDTEIQSDNSSNDTQITS